MPDPGGHPSDTVATVGERRLIARIRARVGAPPDWIPIGIGDDAAIVTPARGTWDVVTTDSLVEDVHFRRAWSPARAIGAKAVAINLSDLAAMGAAPRVVLLSLVLPPNLPLADFDDLIDGVVSAATAAGAALAGGNLARSPGPLVVDVTAMGSVHPRRVLRRAGGRAGDALYVTGSIGAAAAGLAMLEAGMDRTAIAADLGDCIQRYESPTPRLRCGLIVGGRRAAAACMDLSDGLADAVRQIADASGTGAVVDSSALPIHEGARRWCERTGQDPVTLAVAGGEDYELLFAVPAKRRRGFDAAMARCAGLTATRVGHLTPGPDLWLSRDDSLEPLPQGFTHFTGAKTEA